MRLFPLKKFLPLFQCLIVSFGGVVSAPAIPSIPDPGNPEKKDDDRQTKLISAQIKSKHAQSTVQVLTTVNP